jgi:uncharacterized protein YndB with AHSA1/START domain
VTGIYVSIVIGAPPHEVWEAVADVSSHLRWMTDADAIRFESAQTSGVGTRFVTDTKVGFIRLADHLEITEWVEGRAIGVRHEGLVTGSGRFTLDGAVDGGTLFAWEEQLRFPWWLGGRLAEAAAGLVLRPIWQRNLRRLKQLVETGPSPWRP